MTRQVDNLTRQVTEFECFIVLEVNIEGVFEHRRIVEAVNRRESFLDLANSMTDAD